MGNFRHQSFRDRAERDAIDREKDTASLKSVRRTRILFSCEVVYTFLDGRTIRQGRPRHRAFFRSECPHRSHQG